MSIINNDKSIEYNVILTEVERMISDLSRVGVDTSAFSVEIDTIVKECSRGVSGKDITVGPIQSLVETTREYVYQKAIKELQKIKNEIIMYGVYFEAYEFCHELEMTLENSSSLSETQVHSYAARLLEMIKKINTSDTRDYRKQEKIITKIYGIAYQLLKCELAIGSSTIFDEAVVNPIVNSYIHREIANELETLNPKSVASKAILQCAAQIRSRSLDYSYVNIDLLNLISNRKTIKEISKTDIIAKIHDLEALMEYYKTKIADIEANIAKSKQKVFDFKFFSAVTAIALSGLIYISAAAHYINQQAVKIVYPTRKNIYASDVQQTPNNEPENREQLQVGETTYIIEYEPWEEGLFKYRYTRDVITYNMGDISLETLPEYLELDLEELGIKGTSNTETKGSLEPEDLYQDKIYEVIQYVQDLDKGETVPDDGDFILLLALAFLAELVVYEILLKVGSKKFITLDKIADFKHWLSFSESKKEEVQRYQKPLKEYTTKLLAVCAEHQEAAKTFIELYEKYLKYTATPDITKEYMRLTREQK